MDESPEALNTPVSIAVTDAGIVMVSKSPSCENAFALIVFKPSCKVTELIALRVKAPEPT